jgi:hypothetical protein
MFEHFQNAPLPREVTLSGIFNVPIDEHSSNAEKLIANKLPPSANAGSFEHLKKAFEPID